MGWRLTRLLLILLLVPAGVVAWSWWQDPLYWSRWLDVMTHQSPDYMNFRPTADVGGGPIREIPGATDDDARTIAPAALREAEQYAAEYESYALIVVHHGVVQTEWYGPDWSRERLTQSQSMMKTLAALTVGLAVADGYIKSVDEPLSSYLPEWAGDPRGEIRIRDLLQMASGLAQLRFTFNPFAEDSVFRALVSSGRPAEYLRIPAAIPPGREFDYNDMDAALIGLIVQRATGMPWHRWLDQKIWQPMGGAPAKVWLDRDVAGQSDPVTGGAAGDEPLAMTACCMLARAMDWVRVGLMMKDNGLVGGVQVVPAHWIAAMTTPSPQFAGYGYFTWLGTGMTGYSKGVDDRERPQSEPFLAPDLYMLLGRGGQRVYVSPALDLIIVRLGPHNGNAPLKVGWDNARLPNTIIRGIKSR